MLITFPVDFIYVLNMIQNDFVIIKLVCQGTNDRD